MRKVAFVSTLRTAFMHNLMRGALRYADDHPHILIRDFQVARDFGPTKEPHATINHLRAWSSHGILCFLEHAELERLLALLAHPPPIVNMAFTQPRPGVGVVVSQFSLRAEKAVRHFRHQGLRSIGLPMLEAGPGMESNFTETFRRVAGLPANTKATFTEVIDPVLLDNSDAPVTPVPPRLARWLRELPKPTGLLCTQAGGGGYIIRVCHALGLHVPDEIAVIGCDDTDVCLASSPTLTSVLTSGEESGFAAMQLLSQMMAGAPAPDQPVRVHAVELHVRESTSLKRTEICDIAAAQECIRQHACSGISVQEVLQKTQQVSKVTFHKRFMEVTGMTPGQAIRQRQFEEARRLLADTELSMSLIADYCGFGNSNIFAQAFRAREKMTPRDYRKRHKRVDSAKSKQHPK